MQWKTTFYYRPQDYRTWPSYISPEKQVLRLKTNVSGPKIKLIFANEFGIEPLIFAKVTVTLGSKTLVVTKNHQAKIVIAPGVVFESDPIDLAMDCLDELTICTWLAVPTIITSGTVTYSRAVLKVENFKEGSPTPIPQVEEFRMVQENPRMCMVYGVAGVVTLTAKGKNIAVFGDSLTQQGFWIDGMKERLVAEGHRELAILNIGVGGNRVLKETDHSEDGFYRHGYAGLARFETEVFSPRVPDYVIINHGINDFIHRQLYPQQDFVTANEVIAGLEKYVATAKSYGIAPIGVTLAPMQKSIFYEAPLERDRQLINTWLRRNPELKGLIDLDQALQDPTDPTLLLAAADTGDGLHFSATGGRLAAKALDLTLFAEN